MRYINTSIVLIGFFFVFITRAFSSKSVLNKTIIQNKDSTNSSKIKVNYKAKKKVFQVNKSDAEWKKILTPEQFYVLRKKGTESAFTGKYYHNTEDGTYYCAACGNELFNSNEKYDSGSGWPSFYAPADEDDIMEITDVSFGTVRTEIVCSRCGSHLGHVFNDGPAPTGLRFCVNSVSLKFIPKNKKK